MLLADFSANGMPMLAIFECVTKCHGLLPIIETYEITMCFKTC